MNTKKSALTSCPVSLDRNSQGLFHVNYLIQYRCAFNCVNNNMDLLELEQEIVVCVPGKDNIVSPATSTFRTVGISYAETINIPNIPVDCNIGASKVVQEVMNKKITLLDNYNSFLGSKRDESTICSADGSSHHTKAYGNTFDGTLDNSVSKIPHPKQILILPREKAPNCN